MFGFQGGESAETVALKKIAMRDAQARWSFLTNFDLSTIRNVAQLSTMIKIRSSITEARANNDIDAWLRTQPSSLRSATPSPAEPETTRHDYS